MFDIGKRANEFSSESYKENNPKGINNFLDYIKGLGHKIINIKENYSYDITTEREGEKHYFEVEMKLNSPFTCKEDFGHRNVSFLQRKSNLALKKSFWYVIICNDTDYAVRAHSKDIFKPEYIEYFQVTKGKRKGEWDIRYGVPFEYCTFFKIRG